MNFKVYDKEGKLIVEAIDKLTLIRDSWDIIEDGSRHHLNCVTKIKTNPRYIFIYHGEEFVIQKDFMDKYIRIKDVKTNKVISEYEYLTLTPPRKVSINIIEPTLSIYVIICLNLILSTKYD
ncbi:hypothetical protein D3C77_399320 [compost metagenome]